MPKTFPYTQFEIEKAFDDLVPAGEKRQLAVCMDVSEGLVSSWLNPDDDRKSPLYQFLRFLFAADRRGFGETVMQIIHSRRETWILEQAGEEASVNDSRKQLTRNFNEFIESQIQSEPLNEQIADVQNVIDEAERLKKALILERNAVVFSPRVVATQKVRSRI